MECQQGFERCSIVLLREKSLSFPSNCLGALLKFGGALALKAPDRKIETRFFLRDMNI